MPLLKFIYLIHRKTNSIVENVTKYRIRIVLLKTNNLSRQTNHQQTLIYLLSSQTIPDLASEPRKIFVLGNRNVHRNAKILTGQRCNTESCYCNKFIFTSSITIVPSLSSSSIATFDGNAETATQEAQHHQAQIS